MTLDAGAQRIATERAEPYFAHFRRFTGFERQPVIIDQDPLIETLYDRSIFCKIKRHDGNVLQADVLPNIGLGPIGQRKNPDRLAGVDPRVVKIPQLGALCLGLPTVTGRDRKSTRLNSSHGYISYAVFCLKKNKR